MEEKNAQIKIIRVFDNLKLSPNISVVIYQLTFVNSSGENREDFIATFKDNECGEGTWGIGVDIEDALEVASMQFNYYFDGEIKRKNPFKEALKIVQKENKRKR